MAVAASHSHPQQPNGLATVVGKHAERAKIANGDWARPEVSPARKHQLYADNRSVIFIRSLYSSSGSRPCPATAPRSRPPNCGRQPPIEVRMEKRPTSTRSSLTMLRVLTLLENTLTVTPHAARPLRRNSLLVFRSRNFLTTTYYAEALCDRTPGLRYWRSPSWPAHLPTGGH